MEPRNNPRQPIPARSIVSTLIFLAIAAALSLHCYRYSMFGIDLLGYAGTVAFLETGDVVKAHDMVYGAPLTPHLRGLDDNGQQALDMRRRAADPYTAAMHYPYFSIKPLYILALQFVHRMGYSVIDSTRVISALFFFGIAMMLWAYTRSWLVLVVTILPEALLLGQANEPDGMSCFLLLLGLWMVFSLRRDIGLLPLLLAIWTRPENSMLCLLVMVVMMFEGRLDWKKALVLAVLSVGSEVVINHYGYNLQELYTHFLGAARGAGSGSIFSRYLRALAGASNDALHSPLPIFGLTWLVCFPAAKTEMRWVMGITVVFSAVRFVLFPVYDARYYGLFFLTTSIAAVQLIRSGPYHDLLSEASRNIRDRLTRWAVPLT